MYPSLAVTHHMIADVEFFIGGYVCVQKATDLEKIQTSDLLIMGAQRGLNYLKL